MLICHQNQLNFFLAKHHYSKMICSNISFYFPKLHPASCRCCCHHQSGLGWDAAARSAAARSHTAKSRFAACHKKTHGKVFPITRQSIYVCRVPVNLHTANFGAHGKSEISGSVTPDDYKSPFTSSLLCPALERKNYER